MAFGRATQFPCASGWRLMSEFAVFLVSHASLLEDGFEQAPREFLAVKWNNREPSITMNEFAVTAFAWEFLEARSTQFADDFFGSRRQRLPLFVRSQRYSVLPGAMLSRVAIQNVDGFRPSPDPDCSDRLARFDPARGCAPIPIRVPLASSRAHPRANRPATWRRTQRVRNRSRTWVRLGLETPIRCTFASAQYRPDLLNVCEICAFEVIR